MRNELGSNLGRFERIEGDWVGEAASPKDGLDE